MHQCVLAFADDVDRLAEACLRGWTLIGKKNCCPYCNERVDLKRMFPHVWETQSRLFAQILDAVRYLIVWNPLIFLAAQLVFSFFGHLFQFTEHEHAQPDVSAAALAAAGPGVRLN